MTLFQSAVSVTVVGLAIDLTLADASFQRALGTYVDGLTHQGNKLLLPSVYFRCQPIIPPPSRPLLSREESVVSRINPYLPRHTPYTLLLRIRSSPPYPYRVKCHQTHSAEQLCLILTYILTLLRGEIKSLSQTS